MRNGYFVLLCESLLCLVAQSRECLRIADCDFAEHLSVEIDACDFETVHKSGITHTVDTCSSVDTLTALLILIVQFSLFVRQQLFEFSASRFVYVFDGTKISLSLGCLLGKKVAVCRMASLVKTVCCNVETLLCSAMCFLFWHRSAS